MQQDVKRSEEIYLLGPGVTANVKIRDDLLDVKMLEKTDAQGLEQWRPVQKATFPLSDEDAAKALPLLGLPMPLREPAPRTLEQLLAMVTAPSSPVRCVRVAKLRRRFQVSDCAGELTDIAANGKATRTVAIESEDPARVSATVRELGLDAFENVNYTKGLKRLLGL